ncbi:MAG TPA: hypothetical protein VKX41_17545 [Alloacidobacterium sp.]|jgi:hypothetical protein|nr:hypothetical protein [Alloacidobacterium sp.]
MAAFCACCGAEITPRAESCPVCGTPQHGSLPVGFEEVLGSGVGTGQTGAPAKQQSNDSSAV